jgi:hypothetical protein
VTRVVGLLLLEREQQAGGVFELEGMTWNACVTRYRNVPVPGTGTFLRSQPLIDEVAIQRNRPAGIDVEEPQQLTEREVRRGLVEAG